MHQAVHMHDSSERHLSQRRRSAASVAAAAAQQLLVAQQPAAATDMPPAACSHTLQIVTPKSDCFATGVASQVCDAGDVHFDYYFFNITNADKVSGCLQPPAYALQRRWEGVVFRVCDLSLAVVSGLVERAWCWARRGGAPFSRAALAQRSDPRSARVPTVEGWAGAAGVPGGGTVCLPPERGPLQRLLHPRVGGCVVHLPPVERVPARPQLPRVHPGGQRRRGQQVRCGGERGGRAGGRAGGISQRCTR